VKANDRQVGGDHYRTGGLQHWDMFGPEYYMGCATKYVSRWRKKNGMQDLEKAKHYAEKLAEGVRRRPSTFKNDHEFPEARAWMKNAGLDFVEQSIVTALLCWVTADDVQMAIEGIDFLMRNPARVQAGAAMPPPSATMDRAERVADGGSQHASTYPWSVSVAVWNAMSADRQEVLAPFYRHVGGSRVLETVVQNPVLPKELQTCYDFHMLDGLIHWVVNANRIPADLREDYPRLLLELNSVERDHLPTWQRHFYHWIEDDQKWRLRDMYRAWGPEL